MQKWWSESESHSVVCDSLWPHGLYCPWNSLGQNTGVGNLSLLQGIFPTQASNPGFLPCRWILFQLRHKGSHMRINKGCVWNSSPGNHLLLSESSFIFQCFLFGAPEWLSQGEDVRTSDVESGDFEPHLQGSTWIITEIYRSGSTVLWGSSNI